MPKIGSCINKRSGELDSAREEVDEMKIVLILATCLTRRWSAAAAIAWLALWCPIQAETELLGTIDFPTSARSPEAQKHFLHGVKLLHSFTFERAVEAFQEASRVEPDFAMAYWGEALSHNHPLLEERDVEAPRKALRRLAAMREERLAKAPTERERGFLDAVGFLFGEGLADERRVAYSEAMEELAARYPDDPEVQAFYCVSLLGVSYRVDDPDLRIRMRAGAIAQEIFRQNPDHPGAAHYVIHSFDDPIHAPLALVAAKRFAEIAPDAAHALHMPSHIFIQHGIWDRVVASNDESYRSAFNLWQRRDELSETEQHYNDVYVWHALDWGQYGSLQLGDYEKARQNIEMLGPVAEKTEAEWVEGGTGEMTARYIIETERWETIPMTDESKEHELLATGLSAARLGEIAAAEQAEARLAALYEEQDSPENESAKAIAIIHKEVAALVRLAKGQSEEAVTLLEEAVDITETMPPPRGAADPLKPPNELYGEVLLELGRPEEAIKQFEISLARTPNRTLSLRGLARAAAKTGDLVKARECYFRLMKVLDGHRDLPSYREAKRFMTDHEP